MPRLLEVMQVTAISRLTVTASWSGASAGAESASAVFNPPSGWAIAQTQVQVHASSNGSREVSLVDGGSNLVTEAVLEEAFNAASDFAAAQGEDDVKAKLAKKYEQLRWELRKYAANQNAVQATVRAKAHGNPFVRKRGWEDISIICDLIYLGEPDPNSIVANIEMEFGIDVPNLDFGS